MSVTFAILSLAAGTAAVSPGELIAAAEVCVRAVDANGVDEQIITDSGRVRVSTDAEEAASGVRTFGKPGAVPLYLPRRAGPSRGCVAQTERAPEGGIAALLAAAETAFGPPRLALGGLRQWQTDNHSILFSAAGKRDGHIGFAVNPISGARK